MPHLHGVPRSAGTVPAPHPLLPLLDRRSQRCAHRPNELVHPMANESSTAFTPGGARGPSSRVPAAKDGRTRDRGVQGDAMDRCPGLHIGLLQAACRLRNPPSTHQDECNPHGVGELPRSDCAAMRKKWGAGVQVPDSQYRNRQPAMCPGRCEPGSGRDTHFQAAWPMPPHVDPCSEAWTPGAERACRKSFRPKRQAACSSP